MRERGRHDQEITRDLHIEAFHEFDIFEVLLGNESDGDGVDIKFVFLYQMQEKVHGTFEDLQLDLVRHEWLVPFVNGPHGSGPRV